MQTNDIMKNGKDIGLTIDATGASKGEFCKIWPDVKRGLELLRSLTKNPIVKGVISVVESGGDAVASMICGK